MRKVAGMRDMGLRGLCRANRVQKGCRGAADRARSRHGSWLELCTVEMEATNIREVLQCGLVV